MTDRLHIAEPGEGEKAGGQHTEGRFSLIEGTFPESSAGPPAHVHHDCDEGFYVLEGELTVVVDGEPVTASAGSFVLVPRGATHRPSNAAGAPCRFLMLFAPSGMELFFREQAALDWGSLDEAALDDLAARHGMSWDR